MHYCAHTECFNIIPVNLSNNNITHSFLPSPITQDHPPGSICWTTSVDVKTPPPNGMGWRCWHPAKDSPTVVFVSPILLFVASVVALVLLAWKFVTIHQHLFLLMWCFLIHTAVREKCSAVICGYWYCRLSLNLLLWSSVKCKVLLSDQTQHMDLVQQSLIEHYSMFQLSRSTIIR